MTNISIQELPYKEILLLILSFISTYLLWRLQHQKSKIRDIESQLSEKKYKLYSNLVNVIFDIINGNNTGNALSEKELNQRMMDIKRDLFLYASDDIFKTFTEWTLSLNDPETAKSHFKIYFKVMKLARKDMGKTKTRISFDDFMLFLMQNKEEYNKLEKYQGWK